MKGHKILCSKSFIDFDEIQISGNVKRIVQKKKLKNGHFWPPLHKSKPIFMSLQLTYKIFMNSQFYKIIE